MDQKTVKKLLEPGGKKVLYFYMEGCPYCEKTDPQWNYIKTRYPYKFYKIEKDFIPDELKHSIHGFPQFHIIEGSNTRVIEGSRDSKQELEKALQLHGGKTHGRRFGSSRLGRRTRKRRGVKR